MANLTKVFGQVAAALLAMAVAATLQAATQRLEVSSNGRFLVREDGKPFFWMGDTNWRLHKLTRNEIKSYLDHRKSHKFNVIQGPVLLHPNETGESTNAYGATNTDPGNPSEEWFDHIDFIVDAADDRGMYVALVVVWGDHWDHFNSNTQARNFGEWLGNRYKNDENVIWIVAGEYLIDGTGSSIVARWDSLAKGLHEGSENRNLITVHGSYQDGRQSSSVKFHDANWLDFNMIHSGQSGNGEPGGDNWELVRVDRNKNPNKPTLDGEANYEQLNGWDAFGVRRRAYWSVFAGAFGHTYGANGVWSSYGDWGDDNEGDPQHFWYQAIDYPGAKDMKHLRRLMESRPMLKRVPAQNIVLSDPAGVPDHIRATRDSNGRYAMIYVPGANRDFTVDMNMISGSTAKAWWYKPSSGSVTPIGNFPTTGSRNFTTPNEGFDWVLVIDNKSKDYPQPGVGGPLP